MDYIVGGIAVHPRKKCDPLPAVDCAGREWPTELSQVYGRYSDAKSDAMRDCKALCKYLHGRKFRITSHNVFSFCVAFECPHPDTGEAMVVVITPCNRDAYFIR